MKFSTLATFAVIGLAAGQLLQEDNGDWVGGYSDSWLDLHDYPENYYTFLEIQ